MRIHYFNRQEAESAMQEWRDAKYTLPSIDPEYESIRKDIGALYEKVKSTNDYQTDVAMGLELYNYFENIEEFSLRVVANDDFWRYLSVKVVPHIVADRWGEANDDHFWKKGVRIWLRSIWWYVYLSWGRTIEDTRSILLSPNFNTDTILNLVERSGRDGTFIKVYRLIMHYFSRLPKQKIDSFKQSTPGRTDLFRAIMVLHTARSVVIDPALYLGGEQEYVKSLFAEVGCPV